MSNELRLQIYNNLNLKATGELVDIWQKNDRVEWSETTFDVLQEILQQRLGVLPPQGTPVFEYTEIDIQSERDDLAIDDRNPPEFYKPREVLWLDKWIYRVAIASIGAVIITHLIYLPTTQSIVLSFFSGNPAWKFQSWVIAVVAVLLETGLTCILIYFPLRALGTILKILMEMEFNSRGVETENT
jgi:hypothetical protein